MLIVVLDKVVFMEVEVGGVVGGRDDVFVVGDLEIWCYIIWYYEVILCFSYFMVVDVI